MKQKYEKLVTLLREDILEGKYEQWLPGEHPLAEAHGVNFKTIKRAVQSLEKEGLLRTVVGKGRAIVAHGRKHRPRTVLVLSRTEGHVFSDFAMEAVRELQSKGFHPLLVDNDSFKWTAREVDQLLSHHPVGLIMQDLPNFSHDFHEAYKDHFAKRLIWVTSAGDPYPDAVTVRSDSRAGTRMATQHLIDQGHHRILFVQFRWDFDPKEYKNTHHHEMMLGYEEAMNEADLKDQKRSLCVCQKAEAEGLKQIADIFQESPDRRPTAVITYADFWAAKVVAEVQRLGLKVPEDVAVVGYYNTPWTSWCGVPMTSISIEEREIARIMVGKLTEKFVPGEQIKVPPRLVVRASSMANTVTHNFPAEPEIIVDEVFS